MQCQPYNYILSLGYRCSSAGILKSLGVKHASYPFDWLVSRLPIIEHCVENRFKEFLDPLNYENKQSATHYYPTNDPNSRQWICDEKIVFNEWYEKSNILFSKKELYIPRPLDPANDAYAHQLMMNHHDIKTPKDRAYYERCVDRWNNVWSNPRKSLTLYIHPALNYEWFKENKDPVKMELLRFHKATYSPNRDGIYIIPVITPFEDPTQHCAKYVLEEQPDDPAFKNCRICILWANNRFVDAGEIFMGRCNVEEYVVREYVQMVVQLGHLPVISF